MAGITTSIAASFKLECMSAGHCLNATVTPTGTTASGNPVVTGISTISGLSVGMGLSGAGIPAGTVIASIDSTSQITMSKNATASATVTITSIGDSFRMALIKQTPGGTYDFTTTNYSNVTSNNDEVTGTGYISTGVALSNIAPAFSGAIAYGTFGNPSWTGATFNTIGCIVFNSSRRLGTVNRAVGVFDFNGSQTVTAGTFTAILPTANSSTALIRFS